MRVINGNRPELEAELLHAIWTDPTSRYKTLLNKLYPRKPQLLLLKKPTDESVATPLDSDHLSTPSESLEI